MKKRKLKTIAISLVALLIAGGGGYYGYQKYFKAQPKAAQTYNKVKANLGNIEITVPASGTVTSAVTQDIFTASEGTVSFLPFKEGDLIKEGDIVAKITDDTTQKDIEKAENTLAQQQLALSKLKRNIDTNAYVKAPIAATVRVVNIAPEDDIAVIGKALQSAMVLELDGGIDIPISGSGIVAEVYVKPGSKVNKGDNLFRIKQEDIQNSIDAQELVIAQTLNDLNNKREILAKETLVSKVSGMVAAQSFVLGDTVQSGKTVATIIDTNQMQTIVTVDELDIPKVKVGQKAKIVLDALPNKAFDGQVAKIAHIGKTTNSVTSYDVTLSIENPKDVKIGMTANAKIEIQRKDNVVVLPLEMVQGKGDNSFVLVATTNADANKNQGQSINGQGKKTSDQGQNTSDQNVSSNGQGQNTNIQGTNSNGQSGGQGSNNGTSAQNGQTRVNNGNKQGGTVSSADVTVTRKKVQVGMITESTVEIVSGLTAGEEVVVLVSATSSSSSTQQRTATMNPFGGGAVARPAAGGNNGGR